MSTETQSNIELQYCTFTANQVRSPCAVRYQCCVSVRASVVPACAASLSPPSTNLTRWRWHKSARIHFSLGLDIMWFPCERGIELHTHHEQRRSSSRRRPSTAAP